MLARQITLGILALSIAACRPVSPPNIKGEPLIAPTHPQMTEGQFINPIYSSCYLSFEDSEPRNGFKYKLGDGLYVFNIEKGKGFTVTKVDQFAENFDDSNIEITVTGEQSIVRFADTTGEIVEIPLNAQASNHYYGMQLPDHLSPMAGLDELYFSMSEKFPGLSVGGSYYGCTAGKPQ